MTNDQFRTIRQDLNLTQQQLADVLGSDLRSVQRWEAAPGTPTARKVNPIAATAMHWLADGYRPPDWPLAD